MKRNRIICALAVLMLLAAGVIPAVIAEANPIFNSASVSLSSTMTAKFSASLSKTSTVTVTCTLEKKVNNVWKTDKTLTAPPSQTTMKYSAAKDYSGNCSKGNTYRIIVVYTASNESITRTSNEIAYK